MAWGITGTTEQQCVTAFRVLNKTRNAITHCCSVLWSCSYMQFTQKTIIELPPFVNAFNQYLIKGKHFINTVYALTNVSIALMCYPKYDHNLIHWTLFFTIRMSNMFTTIQILWGDVSYSMCHTVYLRIHNSPARKSNLAFFVYIHDLFGVALPNYVQGL